MHIVSQIARRTGITVRTLHHYEAKGLLLPAARSDAGYRLYGQRELLRLQHIARADGYRSRLDDVCMQGDRIDFRLRKSRIHCGGAELPPQCASDSPMHGTLRM